MHNTYTHTLAKVFCENFATFLQNTSGRLLVEKIIVVEF